MTGKQRKELFAEAGTDPDRPIETSEVENPGRKRAAAEREDERVRPSTFRPWAYSLSLPTQEARGLTRIRRRRLP